MRRNQIFLVSFSLQYQSIFKFILSTSDWSVLDYNDYAEISDDEDDQVDYADPGKWAKNRRKR